MQRPRTRQTALITLHNGHHLRREAVQKGCKKRLFRKEARPTGNKDTTIYSEGVIQQSKENKTPKEEGD